jgi:allantoinase
MNATPEPFDILIENALLVSTEGAERGNLAVRDGIIVAMGAGVDGAAHRRIAGGSLFILPGYIDAHVHLNEPGRTAWEGFATGTKALAAGGCTCFMDMPLNSTPVLDAARFAAKAAALEQNSLLDGALWGGLVPGNLGSLAELAACGVIGFKAFMSDSGMDDFPRSDRATLREGMTCAAELGLPVAVHAESDDITARLGRRFQAEGRTGIRDYLDSRPIEAELEAVGEALDLARETGCSLHIVHVSSAAALALVTEAKRAGTDVTAETCPHYLLLDDTDLERIGAAAKCAPPLRSAVEKERLWQSLQGGDIDTIGSDHSPSPPELKKSGNFFEVWGGIAGCQHNYPLLFEEAVLHRKLDPSLIARLTARNVAQRFRLPNKGDLRVGWDADLVVINPNSPHEVRAGDLLTRHPLSAYVGRTTQVAIIATIAGGQLVHHQNQPLPRRSARILRPRPL